ncbi:WD40 repeat-like protein [Violaceomyces palustris]|uniref:WD40 repeat-like protein n=1 Tax=Violaceomyces palustris TaxID=1673888 RepID=A0ACD0P450_9BASI|nr:WD40 repeat-like protein [Violaceomyces palustris]
MASIEEPPSLKDISLESHRIIHRFLLHKGYIGTAKSLREQAQESLGLNPSSFDSSPGSLQLDLETLIEAYNSNLCAQRQKEKLKALASSLSGATVTDPLSLRLEGPATLDFRLTNTYRTLHASNILSLGFFDLPTRFFDTASQPPRFRISLKKCLVSTAADKRIVFSDPADGRVEEMLESSNGSGMAHHAAILCTAQDPKESRCLVSSGMDGKIIVWDLLKRRPVQSLTHHSKFVVRLAFSPSGEYLASAGYDRKIYVYRRSKRYATIGDTRSEGEGEEEDEDEDIEEPEDISPEFELVHEINTAANPEAIIFVRAPCSPPEREVASLEAGRNVTEDGKVLLQPPKEDRTWLVYTIRNDCFLHYVALPLDADRVTSSGSVEETSEMMASTSLSKVSTKDWASLKFNTNPDPEDVHVSYSLLALSLHPSKLYLSAQTGEHETVSSTSTSGSSSSGVASRILLMPLLSDVRAKTLWTGSSTSSYSTPRHSWLPSGKAVWVNSEDGFLRLVDVEGKQRSCVLTHGLARDSETDPQSRGGQEALNAAATWSRGGNTIVKDLVAFEEGKVASCGFDRTVRILTLDPGVAT